jgi:hypothetical protein
VRLGAPAAGGRYALRLRVVDEDGAARWLRRGPLPVRGVWLPGLEVTETARQTELPAGAVRLDVPVGDVVRLVGLEAPGAIGPGDNLPVTLYWSTSGPVGAGYHVTAQLLPTAGDGEPSGPPVAQSDGPPAGGARPMTGWAPNEVVGDERELAVPADLKDGDYVLIAAIYDPERPADRPIARQGDRERDFVVLERYAVRSGDGAP